MKLHRDFGDRVDESGAMAEVDRTDYQLTVVQKESLLQEALAKLGLTTLPDAQFNLATVATVQRSRVQSENAKAKLERARQLFDQKPPLLSEQDFADIETTYEVSRKDLDVALLQANADLAAARTSAGDLAVARQALADTTIVAPASGASPVKDRFAVARRYVNIGSYIKVADPIFDLVADNPIKFRASVPEKFSNDIKTGQLVRMNLEGFKDPVNGEISRINPAIDTASRTFEIEAIVKNADHRLRAGAFARASIIVGKMESAIFVPKRAILSFAGTDKVFTVVDGKAVENRVEQGVTRGDWVQVTSGLKSAVDVVTEGAAKLARGTPVKVALAATSAPAAK